MHGRTTESIDERDEEESDDAPSPEKDATFVAADDCSVDPIHELFATDAITLIRCVRCDNETSNKSSPLIVSLVCPPSQPLR